MQKFTNFHAIRLWSFQNICNEIGWPLFAPPYTSVSFVFASAFTNNTDAYCAAGDLPLNSKCYIKVHNLVHWFIANNDCFSRGGSLAVFSDLGRPSDNKQLVDWLSTSGTGRTYWIGLKIPRWQTTNEGDVFNACVLIFIHKILYL